MIEIEMPMERYLVPIVEARAFQRPVVHPESSHTYYMQRRECRGTQPGNISRIWRYFGLVKGDVKHDSRVSTLPKAPLFTKEGWRSSSPPARGGVSPVSGDEVVGAADGVGLYPRPNVL